MYKTSATKTESKLLFKNVIYIKLTTVYLTYFISGVFTLYKTNNCVPDIFHFRCVHL